MDLINYTLNKKFKKTLKIVLYIYLEKILRSRKQLVTFFSAF